MNKKILLPIFVVFLVADAALGLFWFVEHRGPASGAKQLYTCGMHPQIIRDAPGDCPICGMKLTPIFKPTNTVAGSAAKPADNRDNGSDVIAIDPTTIQKMGLRTALVTRGPLKRQIRTVGVVDFDETSLAEVTTKIKGWVEKLYVDSTGRQVHQGEPLFEIYSPDLYSAQTEYLLLLSQLTNASGPGAEALKASALTKLRYYDISEEQIAELEKTRQAKKTLQVNAPRDGVVVEKMVVQGQMVDAGMKLYRLADLAVVWVQAQVYEQDLPFVQLGQEAVVSLSYFPDRKFRGRVTYIYPTLDEKTRTARVRMEFHNPGYFLKPGMFSTVELESEPDPAAILVPDSAVLRSGENNTVFVALDGGHFAPRSITLGARSADNLYQVLSGLKEGERVVTSGQFMLDSESQLREAIAKMQMPGAAAEPAVSGPTNATETLPIITNAAGSSEYKAAAWVCPMPEHVAIQYDHPGKCPLCGMELVPVSAETLAKIHPGGEVEYYICPMTDACPEPGHGAIKYEKPGKCPVCGMTLIPVLKAAPLPQPAVVGHTN